MVRSGGEKIRHTRSVRWWYVVKIHHVRMGACGGRG